jgi:hypothetical protein
MLRLGRKKDRREKGLLPLVAAKCWGMVLVSSCLSLQMTAAAAGCLVGATRGVPFGVMT